MALDVLTFGALVYFLVGFTPSVANALVAAGLLFAGGLAMQQLFRTVCYLTPDTLSAIAAMGGLIMLFSMYVGRSCGWGWALVHPLSKYLPKNDMLTSLSTPSPQLQRLRHPSPCGPRVVGVDYVREPALLPLYGTDGQRVQRATLRPGQPSHSLECMYTSTSKQPTPSRFWP